MEFMNQRGDPYSAWSVGKYAKRPLAERICAPHNEGGCGYSPSNPYENDRHSMDVHHSSGRSGGGH